MKKLNFGAAFKLAATAIVASSFSIVSTASAEKTVKIGYAVSKTGQNSAGANITTVPNYKLWVDQVNKGGGLKLPGGERRKIEVIEYDDRSSSEEAVRAVERLAVRDKVDFILPPWGTGFNLAIAPLMDKHNYPQLAVTAVTDKAPQFAKRWKKSFWFLGGGRDYATELSNILKSAKDAGKINGKISVVSVADGFGIDLIKAARPALKDAGFDLVYDKTFPIKTSDFSSMINDAKSKGADTFIAFSYPPHTFALVKQAQVVDFNPKIFYLGVGVGFPVFEKIAGKNIDGIMSLGGVNHKSEAFQKYAKTHMDLLGSPPDYWASSVTYASLQMLEQAIGRVGLDREAVAKEISSGSFDTILGNIKLKDNQLRTLWFAGQWQNNKFVGVSPSSREGATDVVIPKARWVKN
ncbi:ABC transporter substrate-binding protein [Sneathiella sp. P13V-1]|uniref:amino acid ABC transporter substrate-binding protein n=1 Tax=Sneathiella sp. P13V-1 TaxID=2697366 RepID=UPI00187B2327|nr:amino acid ABC transporter substrate-binding protein [Sneathiella sp. P13V-1]MBE7637480.1 ABC transporter substrate-binding protein [Sneathiella sp. P13V-1]